MHRLFLFDLCYLCPLAGTLSNCPYLKVQKSTNNSRGRGFSPRISSCTKDSDTVGSLYQGLTVIVVRKVC